MDTPDPTEIGELALREIPLVGIEDAGVLESLIVGGRGHVKVVGQIGDAGPECVQ